MGKLNTSQNILNYNYIRSKYGFGDSIRDFKGPKYRAGGIAIVGQDPGIITSSKVRPVLMLDDSSSSLYRYISIHILGKLQHKVEEVVAF